MMREWASDTEKDEDKVCIKEVTTVGSWSVILLSNFGEHPSELSRKEVRNLGYLQTLAPLWLKVHPQGG